jgi:hypothetical protein
MRVTSVIVGPGKDTGEGIHEYTSRRAPSPRLFATPLSGCRTASGKVGEEWKTLADPPLAGWQMQVGSGLPSWYDNSRQAINRGVR